MRVEEVATATLLVVVILVGTGLGYLLGSENGRVITSTFTSVSTTTSTTRVVSTTASITTLASPIVFNYSSMPRQFFVGNYDISVTQGIGYDYVTSPNGTAYSYSGFYTLFSVLPLMGGAGPEIPFFWNTSSGPSTSHLPYDARCYALHSGSDGCPNSTKSFVGISGILEISWTERASTTWVSFTFESYS